MNTQKVPAGLDFYALTDHEFQVNTEKADEYFALADKYNQDGRFVCLRGYEFSNILYGHRNVYFRDRDAAMICNNKVNNALGMDPKTVRTPDELWSELEATGFKFMTIPHHSSAASHPLTWEFHSARYDRLVEIYSTWGFQRVLW